MPSLDTHSSPLGHAGEHGKPSVQFSVLLDLWSMAGIKLSKAVYLPIRKSSLASYCAWNTESASWDMRAVSQDDPLPTWGSSPLLHTCSGLRLK